MNKVSRRRFLQGSGALALSLLGTGCFNATPQITPPPSTGATDWDGLYQTALGAIPSSARWVATTGNDQNTGTAEKPFLTIAKALEGLPAGGQIVIKDGVYEGENNWINPAIHPIPNGLSNSSRTVIRAEHRFGVRLKQTSRPPGYYQSIVYLPPSSINIWIDGLIAETTWAAARADDNASATIWDEGTNNRITRVIVKKSSCSRYGGSFAYGVGAVLEDCHSIGSGRYAFYGGSAGDSSPSGKAVLRRCISYMPFGPALEPSSSFAFYGSNDGAYALCQDVLFANCYEIDSPHINSLNLNSPEALKWASFYLPKSVRNVRHIGCGSLKNGAEYGAFATDNYGGDTDLLAEYIDCFAWDLFRGSPSSVAAFRKAFNGRIRVTNCTAGLIPGDDLSDLDRSEVSNNLFSDSVAFVTRRENGIGADQRFAIGKFLSGFGEVGYDQPQTNLRLWAFPYETELAALSSELLSRPVGDLPNTSSTSANPYAGSTFTKRIWEATGRSMPALSEIYP
jgi:Protein of unknown function (DUF1565)